MICNPNERYGRLVVIRKAPEAGSDRYLCKCDCGNNKIVRGSKLHSGHTVSCGCFKSNNFVRSKCATKHGMSKTPIYEVWHSMKARCLNPSHKRYLDYGGRGIEVCKEWIDFVGFYEWALQSGYEKGLTIDRIDVNGDYNPSNCRWITNFDQQSNRRNNHLVVDDDGTLLTLTQMSRKSGLSVSKILWKEKQQNKKIQGEQQ